MFKKFFLATIIAFASLASYAQSALKIGTVDIDAVRESMPETSVAETELAKRRQAAETELTRMQTELQNKVQELEAAGDSLDEVTRQSRTEELQITYQRIQQYQQVQGQQLQQYLQQQTALIQEKIIKAINAVGERESFVAIFPIDGVSYFSASQTTDVTALVKTELGIK